MAEAHHTSRNDRQNAAVPRHYLLQNSCKTCQIGVSHASLYLRAGEERFRVSRSDIRNLVERKANHTRDCVNHGGEITWFIHRPVTSERIGNHVRSVGFYQESVTRDGANQVPCPCVFRIGNAPGKGKEDIETCQRFDELNTPRIGVNQDPLWQCVGALQDIQKRLPRAPTVDRDNSPKFFRQSQLPRKDDLLPL